MEVKYHFFDGKELLHQKHAHAMSVQMFCCLFSIQTKDVEANDTLDIQIPPQKLF